MIGSYIEYHLRQCDQKTADDYKYLKRDVALIRGALKRISDGLMSGMEEDQRNFLKKQAQSVKLVTERADPVRRELGFFMEPSDYYLLMGSVARENCEMCLKHGGQVKQCRVRKLFDKYANEPETTVSECGWMDVDWQETIKERLK